MTQSNLTRALTAAEVVITGERFCSVCRKHRPAAGFALIPTSNGSKRWACPKCAAHKSKPKVRR